DAALSDAGRPRREINLRASVFVRQPADRLGDADSCGPAKAESLHPIAQACNFQSIRRRLEKHVARALDGVRKRQKARLVVIVAFVRIVGRYLMVRNLLRIELAELRRRPAPAAAVARLADDQIARALDSLIHLQNALRDRADADQRLDR